MGVAVAPHPRVIAGVGVQRAKHKGPFTDAEAQTLVRIGRHVEKSMRLSIRLQDAEVAKLALGEALAKLGSGVFLLDAGGHVVFANAAAQGVIGDGLTLVHRQLVAGDPAARAGLDAAIASQLRSGFPCDETTSPVLLRSRHSQRPMAAYVLPAGAPLKQNFAGGLDATLGAGGGPLSNVAAMVLVVNFDDRAPPDASLLRDLLGVTLGEARLAALVGTGIAPRQAAEMLDITEQTARVVLKRVFAKTGISRQSELAALISRLTLAT